MDFVTVSKAVSVGEAELVKTRLEANGFFVNLKSDDDAISFGYGGAIGGVQVQVKESDAESARALLASEDAEPT